MSRAGWTRRVLVATGAAIMGYAAVGAYTDPDVHLGRHLTWLAGLLVLHDAVVLPAAVGVGAAIGRLVPVPARAVVRIAAFVTVTLLVVALPLLVDPHPRPDDPSVRPGSYARGFATAVGAVWTAAGAAVLLRRRRPGAGPASGRFSRPYGGSAGTRRRPRPGTRRR